VELGSDIFQIVRRPNVILPIEKPRHAECLRHVVALRAMFIKRCCAEGASEDDSWQLNVER
jgi:hypothetical protein